MQACMSDLSSTNQYTQRPGDEVLARRSCYTNSTIGSSGIAIAGYRHLRLPAERPAWVR